jgi:iron-sulfur cluster assembly protein
MSTAQRPEASVNVGLTEKAQEQVRGFIEQEDVSPETAGLRVSVMPGGCSGFKYALNIEEKPLDDDLIVKQGDLRIFVDAFSAQYLNGTEHRDRLRHYHAGFRIHVQQPELDRWMRVRRVVFCLISSCSSRGQERPAKIRRPFLHLQRRGE